ncbi:MAG: response regulator [Lentisphaerae bacterium]|nr:response regulator [Lentisphaerota bacterium]
MRLRSRLFVILLVTVTGFGAVAYIIQNRVLQPSYVRLEQDAARRDVARCTQAIHRELKHLIILAQDWGSWNDTYRYVQDHNADYETSNLTPEAFRLNALHALILSDVDGRVIWGQVRDPASGQRVTVAELSGDRLPPGSPLMLRDETQAVSGILVTRRGPMLVAAVPILDSESKGPLHGTVIMGRFLDRAMLSRLREQTRVDFRVRLVSPARATFLGHPSLSRAVRRGEVLVEEASAELLNGYGVLRDIDGRPALLIRAYVPREITLAGTRATRVALALMCGAGLLISGVMLIYIQATVVRPVLQLKRHAVAIRGPSDLSRRVELGHGDELSELAGSLNDLSARLHALSTEQEARIAERTRALAEANERLQQEVDQHHRVEAERQRLETQLRRSQKMEAIGALAGSVAHDLNNLLSGMVSYPDLLLTDAPPGSALASGLMTIRKTGERAAAIVRDLLTLGQGVAHERMPIAVNQLVAAYLASPEHRRIMTDHPGVTVQTDLRDSLPVIVGSAPYLTKVMMNLVLNACDAMPAGGVISIQTNRCPVEAGPPGGAVEPGDYVTLTVSDSGVGLSATDLERVFEPYYSRKVRGGGGTGLGLAIVWNAVREHGGTVTVRNNVGPGSEFTLYFPCQGQPPPQPRLDGVEGAPGGHGEMVLVVDDVASQREIASRMLEHLGYRTASASSGVDAVAYVQRQPVDLVLLDMVMESGIDGLETYRRLLAIRPGLRAVVASGFAHAQQIDDVQKLGVGATLAKPYSLAQLALAIHAGLTRPVT